MKILDAGFFFFDPQEHHHHHHHLGLLFSLLLLQGLRPDAGAPLGDLHGQLRQWRWVLPLLLFGGPRLRPDRPRWHLRARLPPHRRGPPLWNPPAPEEDQPAEGLPHVVDQVTPPLPAALSCFSVALNKEKKPGDSGDIFLLFPFLFSVVMPCISYIYGPSLSSNSVFKRTTFVDQIVSWSSCLPTEDKINLKTSGDIFFPFCFLCGDALYELVLMAFIAAWSPCMAIEGKINPKSWTLYLKVFISLSKEEELTGSRCTFFFLVSLWWCLVKANSLVFC